jgi:2-methylcitrate dehydratase PrpD
VSTAAAPLLPHATRELAAFAAHLQFDDLPRSVIERIKTSLLDSVGCCLFGATLPWTRKVRDMVIAEGGAPVASIFGAGARTSVSQAVLVNSTAGHAFELDDIHKESIIHPGSLAAPVALALAEAAAGATGRDVITAMVAGYEVGTRVGNAATMSLFLRGFHPQGTSGAFVAAATAGRMLGLSAGQMQDALGIVGSQAAGLMAAQEGAMVKRFHSGRAAQSGVYSALLARRGFTGISEALEAAYGGYLSTLSDQPAPQKLTAGLGSVWETDHVGYKPHASVTSIHTALDALAGLMRENRLSAADVEQVDVGVSHMTHVHCAWDYRAQGVTAAQMNLYYGLAVIALDGMAFVEQYREERLNDPRILDFIRRIHASVDRAIEALGPAYRHAARVKLRTRDGRVLAREILHRHGSPENPLTAADIEHKFRNITRACLPSDQIGRVVEIVRNFDQVADTREFIDILAAPGTA